MAPRLLTRSKMRDFLERFMVHVLVAVDDDAFNLVGLRFLWTGSAVVVHWNSQCTFTVCHVFEGYQRKSVACNQVTYLVCDLG